MTGLTPVNQFRPKEKIMINLWFPALAFLLVLVLPVMALADSHDEVTIRMMTMDESSTEHVTRMIQLPEIYIDGAHQPEGKHAAKTSAQIDAGVEETSQTGNNQNNPMDQSMEQFQFQFQQPDNEIQSDSPAEIVHEMEQQQEQLQNDIRTEQDDHHPVNQPQEPGQNGPGPDRAGSDG